MRVEKVDELTAAAADVEDVAFRACLAEALAKAGEERQIRLLAFADDGLRSSELVFEADVLVGVE